MDLNNITLLDVIDRRTLQNLQDAFAAATGMAALATDENGPVTEGSNFTDFCMKLTRKSHVGAERCNQCDLKGGEEASRILLHQRTYGFCRSSSRERKAHRLPHRRSGAPRGA